MSTVKAADSVVHLEKAGFEGWVKSERTGATDRKVQEGGHEVKGIEPKYTFHLVMREREREREREKLL